MKTVISGLPSSYSVGTNSGGLGCYRGLLRPQSQLSCFISGNVCSDWSTSDCCCHFPAVVITSVFWNKPLSVIRSPLWHLDFRQPLTCSVLWLYFSSLQSPEERKPLQRRVSVNLLSVLHYVSFCIWGWFLSADFSHTLLEAVLQLFKIHPINLWTYADPRIPRKRGFRD